MKRIIAIIICAVCFIPLAFAATAIRNDTSQTNNYAPNAVIDKYKPYCDATGALAGYYMPAATNLTYNASGVVSTISEMDGTSGVVGTNTFNSTLTYSGANVISTSCPVKQ